MSFKLNVSITLVQVTEDAYSRTCDTSLCGEIAPEIKKDKGVDLGVEDIGVSLTSLFYRRFGCRKRQ